MAQYNKECPVARDLVKAGFAKCPVKDGKHACNTSAMKKHFPMFQDDRQKPAGAKNPLIESKDM